MINTGNKTRGLTLIELITTVAIISIISGISWHYFEGTQRRSYRTDAIIALTKARAFAEKCYSNYRDYTNSACNLPTTPAEKNLTQSPKALYSIAYSSRSADAYVLQATTQGAQVDDNECQVIGITNTGDTSAAVAGSTNDKCWPK